MDKTETKSYIIKARIDEHDLENIIIDGVETGIGYWAFFHNDTPEFEQYKGKGLALSEKIADIILKRNGAVQITDKDNDIQAKYALNLERLLKGIDMNTEQRSWDCDLENYDADTVDAIFQYAIFDDVVFG